MCPHFIFPLSHPALGAGGSAMATAGLETRLWGSPEFWEGPLCLPLHFPVFPLSSSPSP